MCPPRCTVGGIWDLYVVHAIACAIYWATTNKLFVPEDSPPHFFGLPWKLLVLGTELKDNTFYC